MTRVVTEDDFNKPKIKFEITIDGVIDVEDQIEIRKLYDSLVEFTTEHGGMRVTKRAGELSIMKAEEEGTQKTHTIAPVNINLDEKNIKLIAEMVHQGIIQRFEKENRYKTYVMHSL